MWPLAIMAVAAVAQYYQSEKARGANADQLKKIQDQFNSIKPPEWNVTADDPVDKLQALPPPPNYDMSKITPATIQMVGQYSPEIAARVSEASPQLAQASQAAQTGRQAQLTALDKYQNIAQGGQDPELQQAMSQAAQQGDREAQSRQASVLQDAARRGTLNSGAMLAGQLQGSSDSSQRAASAQQSAAVASYQNRLNALSQGAQLGGNIRASEMNEANNNADIINGFNQRQTAGYQNYLNNAANVTNSANLRNMNEQQRIQEANIGNQYQGDLQNRNYQNQIQDLQYNRALTERNAQYDAAQTARARKDQLTQTMYNNARGNFQDANGLNQQSMAQNTQAAADRNRLIQGVADTGATAYNNQQYLDRRYPQTNAQTTQQPQQQSSASYSAAPNQSQGVPSGYDPYAKDREDQFYGQ